MNISRNSWHYKLYDKFSTDIHEPTNLCQYVGGFINIVFRLFMILLCIITVVGLFFVFPFIQWHWKGFYVMAIYVAIPLLVWGIVKLIETNQASILGEYVRAKKKGICPKIDLVD